MRLLEKARAEDAQWHVPQDRCEFQRAGPGGVCLVQLAEQRVDVRHERTDAAAPATVAQSPGEHLGLAQALQRPPHFTELVQHGPQLEADVDA